MTEEEMIVERQARGQRRRERKARNDIQRQRWEEYRRNWMSDPTFRQQVLTQERED